MTVAIKQKNGMYSIRRVAAESCRLLVAFGPYLRVFFKDRSSLVGALAAMEVACSTLITELDEARIDLYPPP